MHSHDGIDWSTWIDRLRGADELAANALRQVAQRLVRPDTRVVVDVGCGAGGMGAAFAQALPPGGTVVLVDAEPELLRAATAHVRAVRGSRSGPCRPTPPMTGCWTWLRVPTWCSPRPWCTTCPTSSAASSG